MGSRKDENPRISRRLSRSAGSRTGSRKPTSRLGFASPGLRLQSRRLAVGVFSRCVLRYIALSHPQPQSRLFPAGRHYRGRRIPGRLALPNTSPSPQRGFPTAAGWACGYGFLGEHPRTFLWPCSYRTALSTNSRQAQRRNHPPPPPHPCRAVGAGHGGLSTNTATARKSKAPLLLRERRAAIFRGCYFTSATPCRSSAANANKSFPKT